MWSRARGTQGLNCCLRETKDQQTRNNTQRQETQWQVLDYFPVKKNRCISSKLEKMKSCAIMEAMRSCLHAILLDFLKIREEISVSVHILRFYFFKSFSSKAL